MPKISRPPMPMPPSTTRTERIRAQRRRIGAQEPGDAESPGPPDDERQDDAGIAQGFGADAAGRAAAGGGRARLAALRCCCCSLALDLPPARHVAIVLGQRRGEGVAALAVGDEIERALARRVDRGQDRRAARIADRPGRQAGHDIGVVRRVRLQVGARQLAAELPLPPVRP